MDEIHLTLSCLACGEASHTENSSPYLYKLARYQFNYCYQVKLPINNVCNFGPFKKSLLSIGIIEVVILQGASGYMSSSGEALSFP